MRLIDADALRIRFMLPVAQIKGLGLETVIAVRDVMDFIKTAPTVEPKRGRWEVGGGDPGRRIFDAWICSNCQRTTWLVNLQRKMDYEYCPWCGVLMDGGENDA